MEERQGDIIIDWIIISYIIFAFLLIWFFGTITGLINPLIWFMDYKEPQEIPRLEEENTITLPVIPTEPCPTCKPGELTRVQSDVVEALVRLGYKRVKAKDAVVSIREQMSIEDLLKASMKKMMEN